VDLGKTRCRIRVDLAGRRFEHEGPGAPGLAAADGAGLALRTILEVVDALPEEVRTAVDRMGAGAAGAESDREAAEGLARELSCRLARPVVLCSDVITAHIGALGSAAGTVLVAGTGATACHVGADGRSCRGDGWGPLLGDEGSGRWIGQAGLQSALRAYDGRGPQTALVTAAERLPGGVPGLPGYVYGSDDPARTLASFAPTVLEHAGAGDPVAGAIVDEAVRLLTQTVAAIAPPQEPVSVTGGLAAHPVFSDKLSVSLRARGLRPTPPAGDALDGAARIARRTDLLHERHAIRVRPDA
jgi:N-acetylglucosamine kinase-like BadF-type ATPase